MAYVITNGLKYLQTSNIIFAAGGNTGSMRWIFRQQFEATQSNLLYFEPENIFDKWISGPGSTKNLADFEALAAEISQLIVIFPEGPGSFAELGFFSNSKNIAAKTLVVGQYEYQLPRSFLRLGPISTIAKDTAHPPVWVEYNAQSARELIKYVIDSQAKRLSYHRFDKKNVALLQKKNTPSASAKYLYIYCALILAFLDMCVVCSKEDSRYLLKLILGNHFRPSALHDAFFILCGCGLLREHVDESLYFRSHLPAFHKWDTQHTNEVSNLAIQASSVLLKTPIYSSILEELLDK